MTIRVLGIDPGTAVTGYGLLEPAQGQHGRLIECGVIRTEANEPIGRRLQVIYEGVTELIRRLSPTTIALEDVFYGKNVRTTVALSHARGVILLAASRADIDVSAISPATVKKRVVGTGGAAKPQVAYMVQQLLRLKHPPAPPDAADACAVALAHLLAGAWVA